MDVKMIDSVQLTVRTHESTGRGGCWREPWELGREQPGRGIVVGPLWGL